MYLFTFFLLLSLFYLFMEFFSKKLLVLLSLEGLMLVLILFFFVHGGHQSDSFIVPLLFSVLMVLDSTFCLSCLVSVSRSSSVLAFNSCSFI